MPTPNEPAASLTCEQREEVRRAADRLGREFTGTFSEDAIEHYLRNTEALLESRGRVSARLPVLIESLTRDRLRALARLEVGTLDKPAVLFLCVHNAGRSQMAAGWLRHLAGDAVDVFSGGSDPGADVNPAAVRVMAEVGIDITAEHPKPWTDDIARAADVIVTMGCGDACPVFPGTRHEDWELDDPAGQGADAVRPIRDEIERRVRTLLASLQVPIEDP
jgi:protein-tyrosine-phosphatase